ncbi:MAG: hypothetical protein ACYSWZ_06180 [Planctomycetota bacterium]
MLHVDTGMCHLAAVSGIPQAAGPNALSQRILLPSLSLNGLYLTIVQVSCTARTVAIRANFAGLKSAAASVDAH